MQHKYRCLIRWRHKQWGPQMEKLAAEGSSIRRALNAALLGFFSDKSNRDRRRDAHTYIEIEAWRTKEPTIERHRTPRRAR